MNGVHDMGGQQCHGAVEPEVDEPLFHHPWERRVLGLTLACGATGSWNLDQSRSSRETLPPSYYLSAGYYRIWLAGLEKMLLQSQMITEAELADYEMREPAIAVKRVVQPEQVSAMLAAGSPVDREATSPAMYKVGDTVRVRNYQPATHTRLPGYIRGHVGTVALVQGCHVYPDSHSQGEGENPQWLYCIEFRSADLWGDAADTGSVMVDCWQPYLENPQAPG